MAAAQTQLRCWLPHLQAAGRSYAELCMRLPWTTAFAVCYVKSSLSDVLAQRFVEGHTQIDFSRNAVFATFGGWYAGWFQHFVYNLLYSRLYGNGTDWRTIAKKVATDSFVHTPFVCLPCCFLWQEGLLPLRTGAPCPRCELGLFPDVVTRWRSEVMDIMYAYWVIWTPGHIITFGFLPAPLRISWVAAVSGAYLVLFSYLSHRHVKVTVGA